MTNVCIAVSSVYENGIGPYWSAVVDASIVTHHDG